MYLEKISILNFKNILSCELSFSPNINCFLGQNGVGKTNLLDAVYYLSFCKSHQNAIDSQLINHDAEFFMLQGSYCDEAAMEQISCSVKRRSKKQFRRNRKEYERLSDHIGFIPAVLVSPSDMELIGEGSDGRRRFLDTVISQYDKQYLSALIRYNSALQNRNALLKQEQEPDPLMLDIVEAQMAEQGEVIFERRSMFMSDFVIQFQQYYKEITDGLEAVSLRYVSHCQKGDLRELLQECRNRDRILGYTTRGIHKDDLEMLLGEYPIKRIGSQGQNKSYLVALKLAQCAFLKEHTNKKPLLLLDDLFDKLDGERVSRIVRLVNDPSFGQIFITDTNREHLDEWIRLFGDEAKIFEVEKGEFVLRS